MTIYNKKHKLMLCNQTGDLFLFLLHTIIMIIGAIGKTKAGEIVYLFEPWSRCDNCGEQ